MNFILETYQTVKPINMQLEGHDARILAEPLPAVKNVSIEKRRSVAINQPSIENPTEASSHFIIHVKNPPAHQKRASIKLGEMLKDELRYMPSGYDPSKSVSYVNPKRLRHHFDQSLAEQSKAF
mgnify:FL=1